MRHDPSIPSVPGRVGIRRRPSAWPALHCMHASRPAASSSWPTTTLSWRPWLLPRLSSSGPSSETPIEADLFLSIHCITASTRRRHSRHQPFPSPSPTYPSPQSKSANPPRPTSPHPKLIDTSRAVALLSGVPIDAYYVNHLLVCSTYQPALVHHIASLKRDRHQAIRQDAPCQLPDTPLSCPPSSVNCLEFAGSSSRTRACDGIHHDRASISRGCHSTGTHALCIVRPTSTVL